MNGKQAIVITLIFFLLLSVTPTSAFSVNSLKIEVQENGDNKVFGEYSLSWSDHLYLWIMGLLGDKKEKLIESKIEEKMDMELTSFRLKDDHATFSIKDYSGKVNRKDGTWYYTIDGLNEDACGKINIKKIFVIFPDGCILEFDKKLPANLRHLEDENLAMLYVEAKVTKGIYETIKPLYSDIRSGIGAGPFLEKINVKLLKIVVTSPIPYSYLTELEYYANFEKHAGEFYTALDYMAKHGERWAKEIYPVGQHIDKMVELKEEEINLIHSMTSDYEVSSENRESLRQSLIDNLEEQRQLLVCIKSMTKEKTIYETDSPEDKEITRKFNDVLKVGRKVVSTSYDVVDD